MSFNTCFFCICWDWSCGFCHFFCWCGVAPWFVCWTIFVTLGWIQPDHGVWSSFLCIIGFSLLILCWEFLHLYSLKILTYNFLFWLCLCLVLVSQWWWLHRVTLGVSLPLQSFGEFEDLYMFFVCLVEFPSEVIQS